MPDEEDDAERKMMTLLDDARRQMRALVAQIVDLLADQTRQLAADLGDPYTDENMMFWAILSNVLVTTRHRVSGNSSALRTVVDLAKTVKPHQRLQWLAAKGVTDDMSDRMDAGASVGLGEVCLNCKPDDSARDRVVVLAACARFYCVPPSHASAIGDVVTVMMAPVASRRDGSNWNLPQHWASVYAYVVAAIAARCLHHE